MPNSLTVDEVFTDAFDEHLRVIHALKDQQPVLAQISKQIANAILQGKKVLWCGNGGSAADAQHLAAEFMGRFRRERKPMPSIALTTDTSILSAIGNDYGFEHVFSRQVVALCKPGDIVVGISTSGKSRNVVEALKATRACGGIAIALTGADGGMMAGVSDLTVCVPSKETARIQEGHILCGHMLCDWVELAWVEYTEEKQIR